MARIKVVMPKNQGGAGYQAWLNYQTIKRECSDAYKKYFERFSVTGNCKVLETARKEIVRAAKGIFDIDAVETDAAETKPCIHLTTVNNGEADTLEGSFAVKVTENSITIIGQDGVGVLYGVFHLLRCMGTGKSPEEAVTRQSTRNKCSDD